MSLKNRIAEKHCIQVSFSDKLNSYLTECGYVCKSDQEVTHSKNYPPGLLTAISPKPKSQLQDFVLCVPLKESPLKENLFVDLQKKRKSLEKLGLSEFTQEMGINSYSELRVIALEWRTDGQMDFAEFRFKRNK